MLNRQDITAVGSYHSKYRGRYSQSYIRYIINKDNEKMCEYSATYPSGVIKVIEELKRLEDEITIEYYVNSGIIKSIDGIDKFDYDKLAELLASKKMEQIQPILDKIEEREKETQRQQEIAKEALEKSKIKDKIISEAIGKNIELVEKEFEDNNLEKYKIKYVSSKLGQVNSIICLDYVDSIFYVVRDNNGEDMVEFPELTVGMTRDEVSKILDSKNIKYKFYSSVYTKDNSKVGTLARVPIKPGRLIPKEVTVGIELYVYNNKN